jgi:RNA polymerase sigma factor (sigma-70 family)
MDVTFGSPGDTIVVMNLLRKNIHRLLQPLGVPGVTDGELLLRFLQQRDQAAFELLVHRHGPMVLGLCRRLLRDIHEAEDAFQATFLTLACRARSIRTHQSLGSWLYKVTLRLCRRMRVRSERWESASVEPPQTLEAPEHEAQRREEAALLSGEVDRLSERLRSVIVLCYLQGKSCIEAARELGCPPNTVSIRLRRARERLKSRLSRRGVGLSSGVAVTLGATAEAGVPVALASAIASDAVKLAAGGLTAGLVAAPVALLVKGALVAMWWKPIKLACLVMLTVGLITVPVWNSSSSLTAQQPPGGWAGQGQGPRFLRDLTEYQVFHERLVRPDPGVHLDISASMYPPDENMPEDAKEWIAEQKKKEDAIRKEAEQRIRQMRAQLYTKLRGLQDKYTRAGDLDRAVSLRDQARRLEASIVDAKPDPGALTAFRGQNGKSFVFTVVGRTDSTIWGDGIYTDDSALAVAAVHAGLVRPGQAGVVKVTIEEGKPGYEGSTRNGVTSQPYQVFPGSYRVQRVDALKIAGDQQSTTDDQRGEVIDITTDGLVRVNKGSENGLTKGQTLEVYRLHPKAQWLGRLRLATVTAGESVGTVEAPEHVKTKVQKGDIVGNFILP